MVLVCVSLMTHEVKHLFRSLLAIWTFSLVDYLFKSSAHFSGGVFLSFFFFFLIDLKFFFFVGYEPFMVMFCRYLLLFGGLPF